VLRRELRELAPTLYAEFNEVVFGGRLPADLELTWNAKLQKTAGQCAFRGTMEHRIASIELSDKVIDSEERLRKTLAHEMCHAGQWVLEASRSPPHGEAFWKWAKRFERRVDGMVVTTCHSYQIHYKYRYACTRCANEFGRQSKSVDLERKRCGRCKGELKLLGAFNRDGTPVKPRAPSAFARYVGENMRLLKAAHPELSHKALMGELGKRFRKEKEAAAQVAGAHVAPAPLPSQLADLCQEIDHDGMEASLAALSL
jgi:predicted SprT family Zn-dependent metalloprotease